MKKISRLLLSLLAGVCLAGVTGVSFAQEHGPHDDLNMRISQLDTRIDHEMKSGHLPPPEAKHLHDELGKIRADEHRMEGRGGHLSPKDETQLNHRVDAVEHELDQGQDRDHDRH